MRKTSRFRHSLFVSSMCLLIGSVACTSAEKKENFIREPQQYSGRAQTFEWRQGSGPIRMMPVAEGLCFLSKVGGHFEGGGEVVAISSEYPFTPSGGMGGRDNMSNAGSWMLYGASQQQDVSARATCVPYRSLLSAHPVSMNSLSPEYIWNQGDAPQSIGRPGESFCYLTKIQGHFEGNGEAVRIQDAGGSLVLTGSSMQLGVGGAARCIAVSSRFVFDTSALRLGASALQEGNQIGHFYETRSKLIYSSRGTCAVTSFGGRFKGGGEFVEIQDAGGSNYLHTGSMQPQLIGGASCLLYRIDINPNDFQDPF